MSTIKYTKTHEWVQPESETMYVIGITDHAQSLLGDVVFVELPAPGSKIQAGESFGVVESVKAAADLYAPLSGRVTQINEALESQPELLNSAATGDGWLIRIESTAIEDFHALLDEEQYHQLIAEEH